MGHLLRIRKATLLVIAISFLCCLLGGCMRFHESGDGENIQPTIGSERTLSTSEMQEDAELIARNYIAQHESTNPENRAYWMEGAIPSYRLEAERAPEQLGEFTYPVFSEQGLQLLVGVDSKAVWEDDRWSHSSVPYLPSDYPEMATLVESQQPCLILYAAESTAQGPEEEKWILSENGDAVFLGSSLADQEQRVSDLDPNKLFALIKGRVTFSNPEERLSI